MPAIVNGPLSAKLISRWKWLALIAQYGKLPLKDIVQSPASANLKGSEHRDVVATIVVALLAGAVQTGRPRGSPLSQAMLGDLQSPQSG
jgi:hypothetical protein